MTDTPSNPLSRLERLKRSIRRFWRTRVVGTICPWCGEREAARFVEYHWLTQGQWAHTRHGKDGWDTTFTTSAPGPLTGWLCSPCARALGVPSPDKDDR